MPDDPQQTTPDPALKDPPTDQTWLEVEHVRDGSDPHDPHDPNE
ncbi:MULTISPECIES: hypothetical protein [Saccharothrix]|nr:hypothetical protein [Saccharothrix sp. CB00851]